MRKRKGFVKIGRWTSQMCLGERDPSAALRCVALDDERGAGE